MAVTLGMTKSKKPEDAPPTTEDFLTSFGAEIAVMLPGIFRNDDMLDHFLVII